MSKPSTPIPAIPAPLVEWLERTEQTSNTAVEPSLAEANYRAGKNYIIDLLRRHLNRQQESILAPDR